MNYHFRIHRESQARKGYWATCLELPGCSTQGDTLDELLSNMSEALNLYLSEPEGTRVVFAPPGRYSGKNIREVAVDPHVAFAVQLRNLRLKHGLTQKQLAARLGIRGLYTYQRLESPERSNPEWATVAKIKKAYPEFCLDELVE